MSARTERKCNATIFGENIERSRKGIFYSGREGSTPNSIVRVYEEKKISNNAPKRRGSTESAELEKFSSIPLNSLIEIDILFRLNSKGLLKGKQIFLPSDCKNVNSIAIETELLESYSDLLFNIAIEPKIKILSIYTAAMGLKCLHDNQILHLDIRPDNMFYSWDGDIPITRIADFEFAEQVEDINLGFHTKEYFGAVLFKPPEILNLLRLSSDEYKDTYEDSKFRPGSITYNYTNKTDIWALGITLLYSLQSTYKREPNIAFWNSLSYNRIRNEIQKTFSTLNRKSYIQSVILPLGLAENIQIELNDLLLGMLEINPDKRFDIDMVVNHNLFKITEVANTHPPKRVGGDLGRVSAKAINKLYNMNCEINKDSLYEIPPLTKEMIGGIRYILAIYKGPYSNYYVRDLFFTLDLYMRIVVACYSESWTINKKIAILSMRMMLKYYYPDQDLNLNGYAAEEYDELENYAVKLFGGVFRLKNLYDDCNNSGETRVILDMLLSNDYEGFRNYFKLNYNGIFAKVDADYATTPDSKIISCRDFFDIDISTSPVASPRSG
jgi:serine/threonine protein kinase